MTQGKCPKCDSDEIYVKRERLNEGISTLCISIWKDTILTNYVCISCGYVESYVTEKKALEQIKKKWDKAN